MSSLKKIIPVLLISCAAANCAYSSEEINITIENSTGKVAKRTMQGKENGIAGDFPEMVGNSQNTSLELSLNGSHRIGIGAVYEIETSPSNPIPEAACLFGISFDKQGNISELVAEHFFAAQCDVRKIDDHNIQFAISPKAGRKSK